eukprot:2492482-Pyramimonas_sp.AAC.1
MDGTEALPKSAPASLHGSSSSLSVLASGQGSSKEFKSILAPSGQGSSKDRTLLTDIVEGATLCERVETGVVAPMRTRRCGGRSRQVARGVQYSSSCASTTLPLASPEVGGHFVSVTLCVTGAEGAQ